MTILPNIAFIGKAGSGKTTCREILEQQFGYQRFSFAEPLKVGCATTDNRELLQRVGQGVRDLYEDFWVNLATVKLDGWWDEESAPWVNDDTRYPNEAAALRERGFVIVRVVAPKWMRVDRLKRNGRLQDEAQLDHVSETALDHWDDDERIVNDGWTTRLVEDLTQIVNKHRA